MLGCQLLTGSSSSHREHARIYGPRDLTDGFLALNLKEDEIRPVLEKIKKLFRKVTRDKQLLGRFFCFGLLDPFTNVQVNSVLFPCWEETHPVADVVRRSLDGLIAFLTHLFPYLPRVEAVGYLNAANADLLVAAHLIIARSGMRRFDFNSAATVAAVRTALKCAAIAAGHPRPDDIVVGWAVLSPGLASLLGPGNMPDACRRVVTKTMIMLRNSDAWLRYLFLKQDAAEALINGDLQLNDAWELAKMRIVNPVKELRLPFARVATKRILLAIIHGFYLQALAMLPTGELQKRYHCSMLMGGHCYGPLDPVSNIIFNTIWYEQTFRDASTTPELQMISTQCLWRVAARSLYGLVSFLCTRYHRLTPDQAMQRLQAAEANLQLADPCLFGTLDPAGGHSRHDKRSCAAVFLQSLMVERKRLPSSSVEESYAAAAIAAFHPDPSAQKVFLGSSDSVSKLKKGSEMLQLQNGRVLSFADLEIASEIVKSASSHHQQEPDEPVKLNKYEYSDTLEYKCRFWEQHQRVVDMVGAALATFNKTVEHPFIIHVICGVNEFVSGPEYMYDKEPGGYNPWTPDIYHDSHINFLAVPKDQPSVWPVLFFAECSNEGSDTCWCVPLRLQDAEAEQIRCIYCECEGHMILHPPTEHFHGRDVEFQKVLLGEPLYDESDEGNYTNDSLIEGKTEVVDQLQDDYIYYNCCADDNVGSDGEAWIAHLDVY